MSAAGSARRPFVGRDRELAQLAGGLDEAAAGRGRFFLVVGEPGIGKSRLCDEIATLGGERGLPVVWGRAWEAGGAPAYWPWLEPFAELARLLDDRALGETLGEGLAQLAELIPDVARRLGAPAAPAPPSDEARFRFWRGASALVRRAAVPRGLVMVFEDLHSADHSSLALLYFVARELRSSRVLLVATCRDVEARLDPEAGELIAKIGREGVTVGLARLDREAAGRMVHERAGSLAPAVVARIFDSTQGNPLYVEEMLRLYAEEGAEAIAAGVVPRGVRDVIRQRLDRLAGDARELLELAAVAGDELDLPLLAIAAGRARSEVGAIVAGAARVGVLIERGGRPRFSHALVREVLYRGLAEDERRGLHGRVAAALEAGRGGEASVPLAELAHHSLEGPPEGLPRAIDFAVQAATRAIDLLAHDEAVALLERAVAAVEAAGNPPALRARALLALAEARIARGDTVAGRAACCEVATLARALDDPELMARAALVYGRVFLYAVVDPVLVGMLEEALAVQPPGDSPMRARLLARLGAALQPTTHTEEPLAVAREAIGVARRLGDRRVLLETLHDGVAALMDIVDPRGRYPLNLETEQLANELGDRVRLLRVLARLAIDHLGLGEIAAADARIEALDALAVELRSSTYAWRVLQLRTIRALIDGRFADADRMIEEAWQIGRAANDPQVDRAMTLHRESALRTMDRHQEMLAFEPRARRERGGFRYGSSWQAFGAAAMFARLEDEEKTRFHLGLVEPDMLPAQDNVLLRFHVAEPVALAGPIDLVRSLYDLLAPLGGQCVMLGMSQMSWEGPVTRLLGLLAARLEDWERAVAHLEEAIERSHRLGARPCQARVQYELGRTLVTRGRASDRSRAEALLTAAMVEGEAMGMTGLVAFARRRLDALGSIGSARAAAPAVLPSEASSPAAKAEPQAPLSASAGSFSLALEGEYWTIRHAGAAFRLKDSLGLQYLARLVATPGRQVHVLDLVSGGGAGEAREAEVVDRGDAGELLDDEARGEYRARLEDLRETLAEAESFGDATRAARAREEIEFLASELSRAVGLGGRSRRAGSAAERARSAVQRRIKNALLRIEESAPALGAYLTRAVKTGNFCVYRPDGG